MKVYQIIRYNLIFEVDGKKHRESTLGPNLDNTAEGSTSALLWMLGDESTLNIRRRFK